MSSTEPEPNQHSLNNLFHRAKAFSSSAERDAFLDHACAGDRELQGRVEALLKADVDAGSFMRTRDDTGSTTKAAPSLEQPGQIIGRYKLLQLIGEGGFGAVFMAEQDEPVRRRVALKIIKPGMDSRMVAARFEAERQALALMDHPHIARILDGGITDPAMGARPYFVMEYVVGDPVTRFADAHRLNIMDRLNLFTQICEAVQHAHTKGIIHRDLKPTNVLVSMVDGRPFAKVIDFGIAKSLSSRLTEKTLFTEHRQLIGTPEYMSPEQAEGSPDIDTRADVYALGVLLYELVTGTTPFDAARLRSAALAEIQRIIKEEDPPAPSIRLSRGLEALASTAAARQSEPARLSTQIKGELDWIVMMALEKDRAQRYETAGQLAADVRRHLSGEAVVAAPASAAYRLRKFVKRNKGRVLATVVVSALIVLGGVGTSIGLVLARQANRDLERQVSVARSTLGRLVATNAPDSSGLVWMMPDDQEIINPSTGRSYASVRSASEVSLDDDGRLFQLHKRVWMAPPVVVGAAGEREDAVPVYLPDKDLIPLLAQRAVELGQLSKMREDGLKAANASLMSQRDEAEWSAYTANLFLAQSALAAHNYPEARKLLAGCAPSKRNWEWQLLSSQADTVILRQPATVLFAAFSPNGAGLVFNQYTDTPRYLSLAPANVGDEIAQLPGHPSLVLGGAFSRDGRRFATYCIGGGVGPIRVWEGLDSGAPRVVEQFDPGGGSTQEVAFDSGGRRLLVACNDGAVRIWDVSRHTVIATFHASAGAVGSAAWSPDERLIVSPTDGGVALWDGMGSLEKPVFLFPSESCDAVPRSFSPDGTRVVTYSMGAAHIEDTRTPSMGNCLATMTSNGGIIRLAQYNHDGTMIVTGATDGTARLWDGTDQYLGRELKALRRHPGATFITAAAFNHNGTLVAVGDLGGTLTIWCSDRAAPMFGAPVWSTHLGGQVNHVAFNSPRDGGLPLLLAISSSLGEEGGTPAFGVSVFSVNDMVRLKPASERDVPLQVSLDALFGERVIAVPGHSAYSPTPTANAIEVATTDGARKIRAAKKRLVEFVDPHADRTVARFPTDRDVVDLRLTRDGQQLVILEYEPGHGFVPEVWDIRDPAERQKDIQREWEDRIPAGAYLDAILAGPMPTHNLRDAVIADASLTPLRRLVAVEMLGERLGVLRAAAASAFDEIQKDQTEKSAVVVRAQAADLPPRVKALVLAEAAKWEYKPPEPSADERLRVESKERRLAEARNALRFAKPVGDTWTFTGRPLKVPDQSALIAALATLEQIRSKYDPETIEAMFLVGQNDKFSASGADLMQEAVDRREAITPVPDSDQIAMWCIVADAQAFQAQWQRAESLYAKVAISASDVLNREGQVQLWEPPFAHFKAAGLDSVAWVSAGITRSDQECMERLLPRYRAAKGELLKQWTSQRLSDVAEYTAERESSTDREEAFALASRAVEADVENVDAHRALASSLLRLGRYQEAILELTESRIRREKHGEPQSPIELALSAIIHGKLGLITEARASLGELRAAMSDPANANTSAKDQRAKALLAEAESLIASPAQTIVPQPGVGAPQPAPAGPSNPTASPKK